MPSTVPSKKFKEGFSVLSITKALTSVLEALSELVYFNHFPSMWKGYGCLHLRFQAKRENFLYCLLQRKILSLDSHSCLERTPCKRSPLL